MAKRYLDPLKAVVELLRLASMQKQHRGPGLDAASKTALTKATKALLWNRSNRESAAPKTQLLAMLDVVVPVYRETRGKDLTRGERIRRLRAGLKRAGFDPPDATVRALAINSPKIKELGGAKDAAEKTVAKLLGLDESRIRQIRGELKNVTKSHSLPVEEPPPIHLLWCAAQALLSVEKLDLRTGRLSADGALLQGLIKVIEKHGGADFRFRHAPEANAAVVIPKAIRDARKKHGKNLKIVKLYLPLA